MQASHQINVLRCIVKYISLENHISSDAFIAPSVNYCNIIWHVCSKWSFYKLETRHKQALMDVPNGFSSSYRDRLDKVSKTKT